MAAGDVETQPLAAPVKKSFLNLTPAEAEGTFWVVTWMFVSSVVVIYNKWVYSIGGFPYPLALTTIHMTSCFVVFGSIRTFAPSSVRTAIMPDAEVVIPWPQYLKSIAAISVVYAATLGFGNVAYLYSSVAFIQMMKPINAMFASFASFALGAESPTLSHIIIITIVCGGIILATSSATEISMVGVGLQLMSSACEGFRLALVQVVTGHSLKLDPVTTVYHFSFLAAVLLGLSSLALESPLNQATLKSKWILIINAALAVVLNVLVAIVIKKTSAVIFALSGIVKDLGIITASCIIFVTPLTIKQMCGYSTSVLGLCMFKQYKDNLPYFREHGFIEGMRFVMRSAIDKKRNTGSVS